jgi:hypothetical protein
MRRFKLPLLVAACVALASCEAIFGPQDHIVVMDVASQRSYCVGVFEMECLVVRVPPDSAWRNFYDPIGGFGYEPGFEYTIRVAWREVKNPPADASSRKYRLVDLLKKTPVGKGPVIATP